VEWNARKVIAKLFGSLGHVQLIVFVAAIREILKREIYSGDKRSFCLVKTKGLLMVAGKFRNESQMQAIRFVNAAQGYSQRAPISRPLPSHRWGGLCLLQCAAPKCGRWSGVNLVAIFRLLSEI
jgi:hypothetical protein